MNARMRAESRTPAMPMTRSRGESAETVDRLRHRVEGVRDGNDDAVGRILHDLLGHRLHDLVVHVQQVVPAHARLARHARGNDHDVGVGAVGVVARAHHARIRSGNRTGLEDVECHARGFLISDVDDDDVREFLVGDAAGHRRSDIAGATHYGYFAIHARSSSSALGHRRQAKGATGGWNRVPFTLSADCAHGRCPCRGYMFLMMASANSDVFSSCAPSMSRAKS